ncbi:TPA: hypothetical protein LA460_000284 [Clostridium botulinum]|nr:hypothetical protein [Clostridium botulinum]HBJ1652888.1 hypothetical protein [Clostridium botulinum]
MITKQIIINKCKEALKLDLNVYIVKIDNKIKFMFSNQTSWEFLKQTGLNYNDILQGLVPKDILKYGSCNDNSLDIIVDMCNQ